MSERTGGESKSEDAWKENRRCSKGESDLFFPERHKDSFKRQQLVKEARAICAQCVVTETCLEFALKNKEKFGIFGGMTEPERRHILMQRMVNAHASPPAEITVPQPEAVVIELQPRAAEDEAAA